MTWALYAIGGADLALAAFSFVSLVREEVQPGARNVGMCFAGLLAASAAALFTVAAGAT